MTLMKPCDEYRKIILGGMQQVLKPHGFRKQVSGFRAERDECILLITLQSSTSTTALQLKATVNLGVFSRVLALRLGNQREPSVWEAHWRERLGFLLPEPHDHWWDVESPDQAREAGREISGLLEVRALPQLEHLASTDALMALWKTGRSPGLTEAQRLMYLACLQGA